jgi:hypothetical protein
VNLHQRSGLIVPPVGLPHLYLGGREKRNETYC